MTSEKKERRWGRIPIRFSESSGEEAASAPADDTSFTGDPDSGRADSVDDVLDSVAQADEIDTGSLSGWEADRDPRDRVGNEASGPVFAELLATRAELKRKEAEVNDLRDKFARRQADFENFRKRVERERSETYNRATAELVTKLLPVLDNLGRALVTEASKEASESDEFRHFLSGVDLIYKQLGGLLETLGVKTVPSVGQPFDPHVHEAVVTEETDEHEPDTVLQEIVRGYRLGDKLLRPALVKVAVKK
ncbi:MAG: nucleotide exchange factor GrpE [Acidobacteria bacterium]|nr:nucleotide exchange factor GrpE [Acidobacteriota bacterium]